MTDANEGRDDHDREVDHEGDPPEECHRRGCTDPPAFVVRERYQEETGHGAVTAEAFLCRAHTAEEGPSNLDGAYAEYVFRIDPIAGAAFPESA
jgi:hypothetical protein